MKSSISHEDLLHLGSFLLKEGSRYNSGSLSLTHKSENDVVTDFDIFLEQIIFNELSRVDPHSDLLSEEKLLSCNSQDAWIVDPLDGTSNFVQNLPLYALCAAKVCDDEVLSSLVVDFASGNVFTAVKGCGGRCNGIPIVRGKSEIKLIGVSTEYLKKGGEIPENWNARIIGSQAIHLCNVACGSFAACINYEAKAWDDVAGALLVSECGGRYENQFRGGGWCDLALSNSSLFSFAASNEEDFESIKKLRERIEK